MENKLVQSKKSAGREKGGAMKNIFIWFFSFVFLTSCADFEKPELEAPNNNLFKINCDHGVVSGAARADGFLRFVRYPGREVVLHLFESKRAFEKADVLHGIAVSSRSIDYARREEYEGRLVHIEGEIGCVHLPDSMFFSIMLTPKKVETMHFSTAVEHAKNQGPNTFKKIVDSSMSKYADDFFSVVADGDIKKFANYFDIEYMNVIKSGYFGRRLKWLLSDSSLSLRSRVVASKNRTNVEIFSSLEDSGLYVGCLNNRQKIEIYEDAEKMNSLSETHDGVCFFFMREKNNFYVDPVQYGLDEEPVIF
jgi:hypothetical protein